MFTIAIAMAMVVVWERNKIIEIGYQVAKLQRNCDELLESNRKLNYYVSRLKSPENIVYKVQSLKLPLILQEDSSGIMIAGQIKLKENVTKAPKINLNKDLYTQKESILGCCSLHY
jgi:ligand-binding sensor protein